MSKLKRRDGPIDWAIGVGDVLLSRAVRSGDELAWPVRDAETGRLKHPYPIDLYEGAAGIGLFLALLGQATGLARFTRAGTAASAYFLKRQQGAAAGLLGLAGAGQAALMQGQDATALRLGRKLHPILPDEAYDLLSGSAGIGTFLLSLHGRTGERESLKSALRRADRLLRAEPSRWYENQGMTVGYAHGPAGIGEFLLRVFAVTGRKRYKDGALRCAKLIDRLEAQDKASATSRWCRGTPGILLFEQAAVSVLGGAAWSRRADRRAQATLEGVMADGEMLWYCHGAAGSLDALTACGSRDAALACARRVLLPRAIRGKTGLSFPGLEGRPGSSGLYEGDAGIGYFLLRLAHPEIPLFFRALPREGRP